MLRLIRWSLLWAPWRYVYRGIDFSVVFFVQSLLALFVYDVELFFVTCTFSCFALEFLVHRTMQGNDGIKLKYVKCSSKLAAQQPVPTVRESLSCFLFQEGRSSKLMCFKSCYTTSSKKNQFKGTGSVSFSFSRKNDNSWLSCEAVQGQFESEAANSKVKNILRHVPNVPPKRVTSTTR